MAEESQKEKQRSSGREPLSTRVFVGSLPRTAPSVHSRVISISWLCRSAAKLTLSYRLSKRLPISFFERTSPLVRARMLFNLEN